MVNLELYDNVGEHITVEKVRSFLNANKSNEVQFDISSLGGDLATAITIHDLISSHPKKTIANIVGLTASAGTVIAIACDEVKISDNALFLIHNGWQEITGNVYDMQKAASDLAKTDAIMVKMYREKTDLPDSKIKEIMKASDWLSPDEALNYGFVDRIEKSGIKIAASVLITGAQGKIEKNLLIKLEKKMIKNPFKSTKAKADVLNVLALKDGKSLLINAEEAATGVEVAPLGAMTLEDGEYELADGRKIVVAGGVITEVVEMEAKIEASNAEIIDAVGAMVVAEVAKVKAEFMAELGKIQSTHKPAKGTISTPSASVVKPDVSDKIKEITDGIFKKIDESRKS